MTHNYKYDNLSEEDRNALDPAIGPKLPVLPISQQPKHTDKKHHIDLRSGLLRSFRLP